VPPDSFAPTTGEFQSIHGMLSGTFSHGTFFAAHSAFAVPFSDGCNEGSLRHVAAARLWRTMRRRERGPCRLEAVRKFAGEDYEAAVVPEKARAVLSHFDARSQHYDVRVERRKE
jgi:hypothetical protein